MVKKTSKEDDKITLQKSVLRGLMDALAGDTPEGEKSDKLDEDDEEVEPHGRYSRKQ